jgi:hypothetical protein
VSAAQCLLKRNRSARHLGGGGSNGGTGTSPHSRTPKSRSFANLDDLLGKEGKEEAGKEVDQWEASGAEAKRGALDWDRVVAAELAPSNGARRCVTLM